MTSTTLGVDPDCAFCAIIAGDDASVETIHEDKTWIAFFPVDPATPGHTLVIPRRHVSDLWRLEAPLSDDLMTAVIRVGRAIQSTLTPEGMNLITSAGRTAEQTVFHVHLHIVPRWHKDGFGKIWPIEGKYEDAELGDVADSIRTALQLSPE